MTAIDTSTGEVIDAAFASIREADGRQIMPELEREIRAALRESILRFGVVQPIAVDQHGDIIDGHNRWAIANELNVPCPSVVYEIASEQEARELAESLNMDRRQMDRTARKQLARSLRDSGYGLVAIAGALGVGKSTVARDLEEDVDADESQVSHDGKPGNVIGSDGVAQPSKKRSWTSDDLLHLLERREAGETVKSLAAEFGCSENNITDRIRAAKKVRDGQIKQTGRSADEVRERENKVRDLAATGHTSKQIAAALGVGRPSVKSIAKRIGVEIPADTVAGRSRHIDSARIATETVSTLEGVAASLRLIDTSELDPAHCDDWATSISESLRVLTRFTKSLKEMARESE